MTLQPSRMGLARANAVVGDPGLAISTGIDHRIVSRAKMPAYVRVWHSRRYGVPHVFAAHFGRVAGRQAFADFAMVNLSRSSQRVLLDLSEHPGILATREMRDAARNQLDVRLYEVTSGLGPGVWIRLIAVEAPYETVQLYIRERHDEGDWGAVYDRAMRLPAPPTWWDFDYEKAGALADEHAKLDADTVAAAAASARNTT